MPTFANGHKFPFNQIVCFVEIVWNIYLSIR